MLFQDAVFNCLFGCVKKDSVIKQSPWSLKKVNVFQQKMGNVDYTGGSVNEHHEMDFKVDDQLTRLHWLEAKMGKLSKAAFEFQNLDTLKAWSMKQVYCYPAYLTYMQSTS